ncbi:nucleotidyltransferase domain-containing protein [candidate division KSB1 bacterium]|nr:nucleotidyltransferase domain-containing protein [candidate division KSB1 bacterium]
MNEIQKALLDLARSKCLPHLMSLDELSSYADRIAFVLVGSVATGLCRKDSDIDMALVCEKDVYKVISQNRPWQVGRPSETTIEGVQLHYYGITFDEIEAKLKALDDVSLYVYSHALVLYDIHNSYEERFAGLLSHIPVIRKRRLEGKLDMLLRRSRALRSCFDEGDIITIARVALELITLSLKVIALLDDVPFDPRKRLFKTALSGNLGRRLAPDMRQLFCVIGNLGNFRDDPETK